VLDLLDTSTRPDVAMREAMARAPVGDDSRGEDPTCNLLCERVADLLGKERALFLPSGTMANLIACATHCARGESALVEESAHIIWAEAGGAALVGVSVRPVRGEAGIYSGDALRAASFVYGAGTPRPALVCVEQTTNFGGGAIWGIPALAEVAQAAQENSLALHLDGARLFNACVATGVAPKDYARWFDSAFVDFSKGLGCPAGAVLAGDEAFINRARLWRRRLGGAMRQAGVLAAAALHALDNNVARLAEDHAAARRFARLLDGTPGLSLTRAPETNIVLFNVTNADAQDFARLLLEAGVRVSAASPNTIRALMHKDLSAADIDAAAACIRATAVAWMG
jgi:threonine aldolase